MNAEAVYHQSDYLQLCRLRERTCTWDFTYTLKTKLTTAVSDTTNSILFATISYINVND